MGFNFSGIAVNKNLQDEIHFLERLLSRKLTYNKEIYFEEAMSYHKDNNDCDIYFTEKGTLVFLPEPIEYSLNDFSEGLKISQFVASETSMVFALELSENQSTTREIQEFNGERMYDDGEKIEGETDEDDGFYVVTKSIEYIIGEDFWEIKPDSKSFRYKMN